MPNSIRYKTYKSQDLPKEIYNQCYKLNFRNGGSMRETLVAVKGGEYMADIAVCIDGKRVVSWCMRVFKYYPKNTDVFMTYTGKDYRNRGIGSRLYARLDKKYPKRKSRVITNDTRAKNFYQSVLNKRRTKVLFERG